ncbi:uncharacterized protein BJ171DRAFT_255504 [Polychytrium aggregatum]|uniref:uncharacterized protein n=1 Tax=Polychytrium aggregatum TaxID=110093 RepID=UPI0022FE4FDE|nr:uncharacterized protein BJ171DRAFT_255504 [Polychytrium aggregatum]KAI9207805.1 hypothetical protein BJ171DRAFT_255504 [Polychytrium aggregatum]
MMSPPPNRMPFMHISSPINSHSGHNLPGTLAEPQFTAQPSNPFQQPTTNPPTHQPTNQPTNQPTRLQPRIFRLPCTTHPARPYSRCSCCSCRSNIIDRLFLALKASATPNPGGWNQAAPAAAHILATLISCIDTAAGRLPPLADSLGEAAGASPEITTMSAADQLNG